MDVRTLGESDSNYTNSSVRQLKQKDATVKRKGSAGSVAAGLLAGAGVGVLAGILLAPKKGKDLRRQVNDSATRLSTQATSFYNTSREKVTSWTGKGKKEAASGSITDPGATTASGRDVAHDPATSITM